MPRVVVSWTSVLSCPEGWDPGVCEKVIKSRQKLSVLLYPLARVVQSTAIDLRMKFSAASFALVAASLAAAAPTPTLELEDRSTIEKRAAINDAANLGYATLNGGTKGGAGGATTTVSTLAQYTAAVAGDSPKVVVVSGTITGAVQARVGSNTSIIGRNSGASTIPTSPFPCFLSPLRRLTLLFQSSLELATTSTKSRT